MHKKYKNASTYLIVVVIVITFLSSFIFLMGKESFSFFKGDDSASVNTLFLTPMRAPSAEDHYRWKTDSQYTAIIYFSIDCVHCRKVGLFLEDIAGEFNGKFNLIYRHRPLDSQPLSSEKALIAECVYVASGDDAMFRFIHDVYSDYRLVQMDNNWVIGLALKYIKDIPQFEKCLHNQEMKEKISLYAGLASLDGAKGVPTIGLFYKDILLGRYNMVNGERAIEVLVRFRNLINSDKREIDGGVYDETGESSSK
jgi:hypothetical protein